MLGRNELTASILISSHYLLYKEMHFNSSPTTRWLLTLSIILILGDSPRIILLSNEQFHTLRARNDNTNQLPRIFIVTDLSRLASVHSSSLPLAPFPFFFARKKQRPPPLEFIPFISTSLSIPPDVSLSLFRVPLLLAGRKSGPSFFLTSGILRADTVRRSKGLAGGGGWVSGPERQLPSDRMDFVASTSDYPLTDLQMRQ